MAVKQKIKPKIIADVKAGKLNKTKIAQKWRISRNTLNKIIREFNAKPGENEAKLNKSIEDRATAQIVKKESNKLYNYTDDYLNNVKNLDAAHKVNLEAFKKELKETGGKLAKADGDKYKSIQQFLKLSAETFKINFDGVRLAMGLDKERGRDQNNIEALIQLRTDKIKKKH